VLWAGSHFFFQLLAGAQFFVQVLFGRPSFLLGWFLFQPAGVSSFLPLFVPSLSADGITIKIQCSWQSDHF
jgi:hypothetical protein